MLSSQTEQLLVGEHSSLSTLLANNGQTRHAVRQATLGIGLAISAALSACNSGEKPEQAEMSTMQNQSFSIGEVRLLHRVEDDHLQLADAVIGGSFSNAGDPADIRVIGGHQLELEEGWVLVNIHKPLHHESPAQQEAQEVIFPWYVVIDDVIDAGAEGTVLLCAKRNNALWVFNVSPDATGQSALVNFARANPDGSVIQNITMDSPGEYIKVFQKTDGYYVEGLENQGNNNRTAKEVKVAPDDPNDLEAPPDPFELGHDEASWFCQELLCPANESATKHGLSMLDVDVSICDCTP